MVLIKLINAAFGAYLTVYVLYTALLLAARFLIREGPSPHRIAATRFAIIIPAHNEELLLGYLLKSISDQEYPHTLLQTIVVADNCTDGTASIGTAHRARVLERKDEDRAGKGYAIKHALDRIHPEEYDAVFIIDADSRIGPDAFKHLDALIQQKKDVIQCYNGVDNPDESWFTRLLDVSRAISNEIYHPAKIKLGLSSYLMGNGMCFSKRFLEKQGWSAFTVGEDWEYYTTVIQAGGVIAFSNGARVYHRESSTLKQAATQRMRWSSGRFEIARKYGFRLLLQGVRERSWIKTDSALPLLFPNPSLGVNLTVAGIVLSSAIPSSEGKYSFLLWYFALICLQLAIFIVGVFFTKNKAMNLFSIVVAPVFLIWKLGIDTLAALGMGKKRWVRTERKL